MQSTSRHRDARSRDWLLPAALSLVFAAGCSVLTDTAGLFPDVVPGDAGDQTGDGSVISDGAVEDEGAHTPSDASTDQGSPEDSATADGSGDGSTACPPPVAYFSLDTAAVVGTTVKDISGSGNDGVVMGDPSSVVPGKFGDAIQFSSTGSTYITSNVVLGTDANAVFTFAFWYQRAGTADETLLMVPSNDPRYSLWLTGNNLCFDTGNFDCWGIQDSTLYDRWVHVVAEFHNGLVTQDQLYVDGIKRSLTCATTGGFGPCTTSRTLASPLTIGGTPDFVFHGAIDDFRIYDRALTSGEVQAIFSGKCQPP